MKAITYEVKLAAYFLGKLAGSRFPSLYYGPVAGLRLKEMPAPTRRKDDWVLVETLYAGVCGSDLAAIFYKSSPALTPFSSFPSVPGHEIVGRVVEVGPAVDDLALGDRVVVEPFLTCASRGVAIACEACREGNYCICHHTAEGPMAPGMIMGACSDHHGGWAETVAAHRSQIFKLPDDLSDRQGVLVEPLSIAVHAILRKLPAAGSKVLVIGSGMIAYAALAAIRMLGLDVHVTVLAHLRYQKDAALRLGADDVICLQDGDSPTERVSTITGAKRHLPILGRDVLTGGFDHVVDCVGSRESLQDALYFAKARASIVLVGAPGVVPGFDVTFLWQKELSIIGTLGYGVESWKGESMRTFDLTMRMMQETALPLEELITHEFTLDDYKQALVANLDRAAYKSIKTVFVPGRA